MTTQPTQRINPALSHLRVRLSNLREDPDNLRVHTGESIDGIVGSLQRFGQQKPIVADESGKILAGNGMYRAALSLGWKEIAAVTMTGAEVEAARLYAIADNRAAELSSWDREQLARQIGTLADLDLDLALHVGWTQNEVEQMQHALSGEIKPEREPSIPKDGLPPTGLVYAAAIELASDEQQGLWLTFCDRLGNLFPDLPSPGKRLVAYIQSLGGPSDE